MEGDIFAFQQFFVARLNVCADLPPLKQMVRIFGYSLSRAEKSLPFSLVDGRIETAFALTAADGVPEGDVIVQQQGKLCLVIGRQFFF